MREVIMRLTVKPYEEATYAEIIQDLVRCRDCEYWKHHSVVLDHDYCELTSTECKGNHFCSWGEKKNEG